MRLTSVTGVLGGLSGLIAGLAAVAVAGCVYVHASEYIGPAAHKEARTVNVACPEPVALEVIAENGRIEVVKALGDQLVVTSKIAATTPERLALTEVRIDRDDDSVRIYAVWPEGKRHGNESCAFEVQVPQTVSVNLNSSNGAIRMDGLSGPAVLETSNGSIKVQDHDGIVTADSSNGAIELVRVTGAVADTSNGSVEIRLRDDAPGPVQVDTSNGSITLAVGSKFSGAVVANTSNGRVTNNVASASAVGKVSRNRGTFAFGAGGAKSVLDTTNGSITIKPVTDSQ